MASVAEFLLDRLEKAGVKHLFGVNGPFIDNFLKLVEPRKSIALVSGHDENHFAIAADAYARINGIGCICLDYNVGALKACNAIAACYSERSPVVVISGSPSIKNRLDESFFHHVVKNFDNQLKIFKQLTCYSAVLDDPTTAGYNIDQALEFLRFRNQPIYLELPIDVAEQPLRYDVYRQGTPIQSPTNEENLNEAFSEVLSLFEDAKTPVIIAGVQIARFRLGDQLIRFAEKNNIPVISTLLSKSFVSENHKLFLGTYAGKDFAHEELNNLIEDSDCLLVLGDPPTDLNFGFNSHKFTKKQMILCSSQGLKIRSHSYKDINFEDFCSKLFKCEFLNKRIEIPEKKHSVEKFIPENNKISVERFFQKILETTKDDVAIISDSGEILKYSYFIKTYQNNFLASPFYCLKDFVLPAILGFGLSKPNFKILAFTSEVGFLLSDFQLRALIENNVNAIIFVLSNLSPKKNENLHLNQDKIIDIIGIENSFTVETEEELCFNLDVALKSKKTTILHVIFGRKDYF